MTEILIVHITFIYRLYKFRVHYQLVVNIGEGESKPFFINFNTDVTQKTNFLSQRFDVESSFPCYGRSFLEDLPDALADKMIFEIATLLYNAAKDDPENRDIFDAGFFEDGHSTSLDEFKTKVFYSILKKKLNIFKKKLGLRNWDL
jgi:hypothetical protein